MSAQTDSTGNMLFQASNVYLEAKNFINNHMTTLGGEFTRYALQNFLERIDYHIGRIRGYQGEFAPRRDGLTKESILIDLENMKARINGLLATIGGRRRRSRKSRKSRRSRRSRKSIKSRKSRK